MNKHSLEEFFLACGAQNPVQLAFGYTGKPKVLLRNIPKPFAIIGRDERAELRLQHPDVSRRHAYLQMIDGRMYCLDLRSRTAIFWPDGPAKEGWILPHQSILLGPFYMQFCQTGPRDLADRGRVKPSNPTDIQAVSDHLPQISLEWVQQGNEPFFWPMKQVLAVLGRSPDCSLQFEEWLPEDEPQQSSVSAVHCILLRTRRGVWIVDLLTRNGIEVNRAPCRFARLDDGDELQIGQCLFRVHLETVASQEIGPSEFDGDGPGLLPDTSRQLMLPDPVDPGTTISDTSRSLTVPPNSLVTRGRTDLAPKPRRRKSGSMQRELARHFKEQFSMMQQMMADHFQQSLETIAQTFASQQKEHQEFVQFELERLREMTRELNELQETIKNRGTEPAASAPPVQEEEAPPEVEESASTHVEEEEQQEQQTEDDTADQSSAEPEEESAGEEAATTAVEEENSTDASATRPAPPAGPSNENAHDWIAQRLTLLQQERKSRWQKLMHFLSGK